MKNKSKKPILEIHSLKKYFVNNAKINKAVDGVSFNVHEGEIVGLIGESGSGKTTVGRSLLRLYNDFNGFVSVNGKITSGKKITKNREKYLRKNIQMIFQDPHASLNGQKTIFSILKEPLEVNGIIKQKAKDLFKDWEDVKFNYPLTFGRRTKELRIKNLKLINKQSSVFFKKWSDTFTDFRFDWEGETLEDNFVSYFNYLEEKQNMESHLINNLYSNTDNLISLYFEMQQNFREKNMTPEEVAYFETREKLQKIKKLTRMSLKKYDAIQKRKQLKEDLKEHKKIVSDYRQTNINAFDNFINEYDKETKISRDARLMTDKLDFYFYNYKKELCNKKKTEVIKELKKELKYLSIDGVKDLVTDLDNYTSDFYAKRLEEIPLKRNYKKLLNDVIETNYKFDSAKYKTLSINQLIKFEEKESNIKKMINDAKMLINVRSKSECTANDYRDALRDFKAKEEFLKSDNFKYAQSIRAQIKELDIEIINETVKYKSFKTQQEYTERKFKENNKIFFEKLKKDFDDAKKSKNKKRIGEAKKNYSIYTHKIKNKISTLKSFEIEFKYLKKDIKTIYLLLGLDQNEKAKQNRFVKFFKNIFAKRKIKNLLTKSIIYKALEDVGLLKQFTYRYPHEFSGGQRQRIVIARALITEPKIIIADEPIASLDVSIQAQVVNLLRDLCEQKNIGMIFIAHDLSMIEYIADRVQIMHRGKIVESGDTDVVYARPIHPYTINLFKAIPKMSNANEKFENINFELDYLKEQRYPNVPKVYLVEEDHLLLGTKKQVNEWIEPFGLKDPVEYQNGKLTVRDDTAHLPFDGRDEVPDNIEYTLLMDKVRETTEMEISHFSLDDSKGKKSKKKSSRKGKND